MDWEIVIGLEVHAQLRTQSKIFSGASTHFGAPPNTQACAIDLGYPGVLPVFNGRAAEMAIRFGLAVDADIARRSIFARKNYFYPDLPKGYQISQFELPIVQGGRLDITLEDGSKKTIRLTRAHLEEDAGKSLHEDFHGMTGVDLNRAGTPLLEIVSEPDMRSAYEAVAYLKKMRTLVQYLEICDGNMQEGSLRCDANVSVRPQGQKELGTRTEIKNLNSFRFIEKAIVHEVDRQIDVIESGGSITQETRLYDADRDETRPMRSKEEANDYRYFPDPDLLPLVLDEAVIQKIKANMPELPVAKHQRFVSAFGLSDYDAEVLTASKESADYFESVVAGLAGEAKLAANWVMGELTASLNRENLAIADSRISATDLAGLLKRIADQTISGKIAKQVFEGMWTGEGSADEIIAARGLKQITDSNEIVRIVDKVITANSDQAKQYRAGKTQVLGFLVGKVMQATQGKANPQQVNELLRKQLGQPEKE